MRKKILFAPLWGIFALSLLSSCRTEDAAIAQKQIEDKRFTVFVPKQGKTVNYANGFAYLMQRYDNLHKTNLSGANNNNNHIIGNLSVSTNKNASIFQVSESYVEFNIRSQVIRGANDDKWVIFPKIEKGSVKDLVVGVLSKNETYVSFYNINTNDKYYTSNISLFDETFKAYQKRRTSITLNASIKPMAFKGDGTGCSENGECKDIEEVVINVPANPDDGGGTPPLPIPPNPGWNPTEPPKGQCPAYQDCNDYGAPNPVPYDKIDVEDLKNYPCAYAIAQELPNLKNELAAALNKIFKNSNKYDLTFKVSTILTGASAIDGETKGPKDPANHQGNFFKQTIYLNKDVLTNATKEYILVTMYHEVVHAYLNAELNRLGEQQFKIDYPGLYFEDLHVIVNGTQVDIKRFSYYKDHQEAATFINTLQGILKSYNPNLSSETANILSRAGMVDLTPNDQKINDRERGINKTLGTPEGTKC